MKAVGKSGAIAAQLGSTATTIYKPRIPTDPCLRAFCFWQPWLDAAD